MTITQSLLTASILGMLGSGIVFAQAPAPRPANRAITAPATPKAQPARTAKSLECSKEADGKSIHGKERKKFMRKCKKS